MSQEFLQSELEDCPIQLGLLNVDIRHWFLARRTKIQMSEIALLESGHLLRCTRFATFFLGRQHIIAISFTLVPVCPRNISDFAFWSA